MAQPQPSTSPFKSSLSFNSGRASPFRRPESPSQGRAASPTPAYQSTRPVTPSKLVNSSTPTLDQTFAARSRDPISPTRLSKSSSNESNTDQIAPLSLPPQTTLPRPLPSPSPTRPMAVNMDTLSRLPQSQVREMREAFQILDQDSDGNVNKEDVAEMLKSLGIYNSEYTNQANSPGLDSSPAVLAPYFPASLPHPMPLPVYLSQLSSLLAPISPPQELLAALSAFDDDDSGQIDISELVQAVTGTRPEDGSQPLSQRDVETIMEGFTGRRAFSAFGQSTNKNRGDVFRYRDWVSGLGAVANSQPKTAA